MSLLLGLRHLCRVLGIDLLQHPGGEFTTTDIRVEFARTSRLCFFLRLFSLRLNSGGISLSRESNLFVLILGISTAVCSVPFGTISLQFSDGSELLAICHLFIGPDFHDVLGDSSHVAHAVLPGGELGVQLLVLSSSSEHLSFFFE